MNPSSAMKKNWEKVMKFPELGTSLKKNHRFKFFDCEVTDHF